MMIQLASHDNEVVVTDGRFFKYIYLFLSVLCGISCEIPCFTFCFNYILFLSWLFDELQPSIQENIGNKFIGIGR